jgi:hypothetical protein
MKKLLVLVGILAAFSLMGCPKDPKDPVDPPASDPIENPAEPETPFEPEDPAFDGNVDLTKLAEYDETAGGLVKDFGTAVNGYNVAFTYKLSDLGYTDEDFTTIVVVADVYNGESKYDLASDWTARLMLKINQTVEVFNSGVDDATQGIKFESKDDVLDIHVKDKPVTKVVVKAIKFVK